MKVLKTVVSICALATASAVLAGSAGAQSVEQFYKGKTVTILLGQPPGGSYDLYARLAADHLTRFVPGAPNFLIQHKPGGGGAVAVSFFYEQAPKDGTTLGLFAETIGHIQLVDPGVGKWKLQEMTYIGSMTGVNAAFVRRKDSPAKTIEEMKQKDMNVGCTGKTSQSYQTSTMLKNLAGLKFKIVCGYPGSAEYVLALERGELDGVSSAWNQWSAGHPHLFENGTFVPVIQTGLRRHPEIKDVPLAQELVSDPKIKQAFEFSSAGSAIGRAILAPPGVPQDRIAALRAAFDQMVKDPEFIADAKKRRAELDPTSGAEVQKAALAIINTPKDIVDMAAKAME
jgi:tripartite-type tricarboxylate transporter receptor subunit TctC